MASGLSQLCFSKFSSAQSTLRVLRGRKLADQMGWSDAIAGRVLVLHVAAYVRSLVHHRISLNPSRHDS